MTQLELPPRLSKLQHHPLVRGGPHPQGPRPYDERTEPQAMRPPTKKYDVGVVVGRFQVDELHHGHREMLDYVKSQHDRVVVMLGTPAMPYGSLNNPLDFQSRLQMILAEYPHFIVLPLQDKRTNEEWSTNLDNLVRGVINPRLSIVLYGGRDSFIPYYKGSLPVQELVSDSAKFMSGTQIREKIKNASHFDFSFRRGAIWQTYNRYPITFPTVDIAILNADHTQVLLAKKPGEAEWRFVGGFAEAGSACFEDDARREVNEETGVEISTPTYVSSHLVDDWRLAKEKDKIKTLFFVATYVFGTPKANDDICELGWHPIHSNIAIVKEHIPLFNSLVKFLNKTVPL